MLKLCFFVPVDSVEPVKDAVFKAGAGRIGLYDRCSWQVLGAGQFRPLPGSNPHVGCEGDVHVLQEYRVEMVCEDALIGGVIQALKLVHPYEEPAFDVTQVLDVSALGLK